MQVVLEASLASANDYDTVRRYSAGNLRDLSAKKEAYPAHMQARNLRAYPGVSSHSLSMRSALGPRSCRITNVVTTENQPNATRTHTSADRHDFSPFVRKIMGVLEYKAIR
ncbi:MAG: hypothetical protein HC888_17830 [Candidatus Competibacteraceae bacterium]|nr:hypothetical protein [Candidatus Competibacteraceae bacterium]